jgi:hypothetical protein
MQTYETGYASASVTGPLRVVTLIAATRPFHLLEFGIGTTGQVTVGPVALGPPAVLGTGSAGTALTAVNPSDPAASAHLVTGAFATIQPTAPAVPYRQFSLPSASVAGTVWGWEPGELIVPTGGQLVLFLISGQYTFIGYIKVAEGG